MLKMVVNNDKVDDIVIPAKPGGKPPSGHDYLSSMRIGTEFLVRPRNGMTPWLLTEFTHGGKKEGNVLLIPTQNINNVKDWIWVDPLLFCSYWEFRGILEEPEE